MAPAIRSRRRRRVDGPAGLCRGTRQHHGPALALGGLAGGADLRAGGSLGGPGRPSHERSGHLHIITRPAPPGAKVDDARRGRNVGRWSSLADRSATCAAACAHGGVTLCSAASCTNRKPSWNCSDDRFSSCRSYAFRARRPARAVRAT